MPRKKQKKLAATVGYNLRSRRIPAPGTVNAALQTTESKYKTQVKELHTVAQYLSAKVGSLEEAVDQLSGVEGAEVVFPGYSEELESLCKQYLNTTDGPGDESVPRNTVGDGTDKATANDGLQDSKLFPTEDGTQSDTWQLYWADRATRYLLRFATAQNPSRMFDVSLLSDNLARSVAARVRQWHAKSHKKRKGVSIGLHHSVEWIRHEQRVSSCIECIQKHKFCIYRTEVRGAGMEEIAFMVLPLPEELRFDASPRDESYWRTPSDQDPQAVKRLRRERKLLKRAKAKKGPGLVQQGEHQHDGMDWEGSDGSPSDEESGATYGLEHIGTGDELIKVVV